MTRPTPSGAMPTGARPPVSLRVLAALTGVLLLIGTTEAVLTESGVGLHSMFTDNRTNNVMAGLMIVLPILGAIVPGWLGFGAATAASLVSAAWALGAVAVTVEEIRDPLAIADRAPGSGAYALAAGSAAGIAAFGLGVRAQQRGDRTAQISGGWSVVGIISSAVVVVGLMLPPRGVEETFLERNLLAGDWPSNVAWLALVAAFGVVGVVGFASRSWFGLAAVVVALVPLAWTMAVYRLGLDSGNERGAWLVQTYELHLMVLVGATGQALGIAGATISAVRAAFLAGQVAV